MHPKARQADLIVEEFNGETLLYDLRTRRAHSLNEVAHAIWQRCDGTRSIEEIAGEVSVNSDEVSAALERFESLGLIDKTTSRRQFLRRAAVGLAVIATISLPKAAHAASQQSKAPPSGSNPMPSTPVETCGRMPIERPFFRH